MVAAVVAAASHAFPLSSTTRKGVKSFALLYPMAGGRRRLRRGSGATVAVTVAMATAVVAAVVAVAAAGGGGGGGCGGDVGGGAGDLRDLGHEI
jgi:hypothetical protein